MAGLVTRTRENRLKALQRKAERVAASCTVTTGSVSSSSVVTPNGSFNGAAPSSTVNKSSSFYGQSSSSNQCSVKSNNNNSNVFERHKFMKQNVESVKRKDWWRSPSKSDFQSNASNKNNHTSSATTSTDGGSYVTGTCRLISKDRFEVDVGYHGKLIDIFKTVPGRMYGKYSN